MKRLPPAAKQLLGQVAQRGKVSVKVTGEPDGFGTFRSVAFDAATSKWLFPALDVIKDKRIASLDYEGKGQGTVTFVGDTRADRVNEFPIEAVSDILDEPEKPAEKVGTGVADSPPNLPQP